MFFFLSVFLDTKEADFLTNVDLIMCSLLESFTSYLLILDFLQVKSSCLVKQIYLENKNVNRSEVHNT